MKITEEKIFDSIRDYLAESLAINADEISLNSSLIDDLGADSLDFLDILFQMERMFSIKLRDSEVNRLLRAEATATPAKSKYLVFEDVKRLQEWLPALSRVPDPEQVAKRDVFSFITVESLVILVKGKLGLTVETTKG